MAIVATSLWFDLLWALAVLGQKTWLWLTALLVLATYGLTVFQRHPLCKKMVWMALVGIAIDSGNMFFGILVFAAGQFPLWLAALWFAFTWYAGHLLPHINHYSKPILCVSGGLLGSLSYWVGYRVGAVYFELPIELVLLVLCLEWMAITGLFLKVMSDEKTMQNSADIAR